MQMVTILYQHGFRHGVPNIYQLLSPSLGPPELGVINYVVVGRTDFFFEVTPHNALFFSASSKIPDNGYTLVFKHDLLLF
jgi:hypothetical protein